MTTTIAAITDERRRSYQEHGFMMLERVVPDGKGIIGVAETFFKSGAIVTP